MSVLLTCNTFFLGLNATESTCAPYIWQSFRFTTIGWFCYACSTILAKMTDYSTVTASWSAPSLLCNHVKIVPVFLFPNILLVSLFFISDITCLTTVFCMDQFFPNFCSMNAASCFWYTCCRCLLACLISTFSNIGDRWETVWSRLVVLTLAAVISVVVAGFPNL